MHLASQLIWFDEDEDCRVATLGEHFKASVTLCEEDGQWALEVCHGDNIIRSRHPAAIDAMLKAERLAAVTSQHELVRQFGPCAKGSAVSEGSNDPV